ncbi:HNH endonuclease [Musicola paradisiaca]|uniref:HNH nuclease n=1 Tax=Musicola paradisiaca (strain Ech703) TaxID=579405 RepID=C6C5L2_MUSP7|nr:HNH endonuclease [Musicola paradisiaca]ACS83825.1 HNH nuclease [Musicola paradisiaca Ech703]
MNKFRVAELPDFLKVKKLNELRHSMQAEIIPPISDIKIKTLDIDELLATTGIDTSIEDIKVNQDNTFDYNNKKVILHIRDVNTYGKEITLPKYHLANCRTLQGMWRRNRSGRYVVATRSDGLFIIKHLDASGTEWETKETRLNVCKSCLETLNWKGYSSKSYQERMTIFNQFSLKEFFEKYPNSKTTYRAEHTDISAPTNTYSNDFNTISKQYRESIHWHCEQCGINLKEKNLNKYLHVHHRDGQKNNNQRSNLQALCIECHSKQDNHGHMNSHHDLAIFLTLKEAL